jgi:hypothetical protein
MIPAPELLCERCDNPIPDQVCTHRDLCADCLWCCSDCAVEFAESLAYDADRDERD